MKHLQRIQNYDQLKILADARRLTILQHLMVKPATLSQLGKLLDEHPAKIRHHLKQLEGAGLIELVDTHVVRGFVEKYYSARARAFTLQEIILPASTKPTTFVAIGSHDLALELLAERLTEFGQDTDAEILTIPVGSLEGLMALRQGTAQLAGCHLLDIESGEYNLPYVRHFFPDRSISLLTLAHREQGLMLAPSNPFGIRDISDLTRADIRFVNRNKGSGTRLWFDLQLDQLGMPSKSINGYEHEVRTHTLVAQTILRDLADVGLGLRASAQQHDLEFIPLFQERYDLVIPQEQLENRYMLPILEKIQSGGFRQHVQHLAGYDTAHTGEVIRP